jgi:serine phosphatase RsbU (regulator of sigma subunit)
MRKLLLFFLVASPVLAAQSLITVNPQQCVWRAGDNSAWAAPNLDESGWQPYALWKLNPAEPRIWIRCHFDPATFRKLDHPAVQIRMASAYEIFLDGAPIAHNGNLASGNLSVDVIRVFAVPRPMIAPTSNVLALRIARRYASLTMENLPPALPEIRAGDEQLLLNDRAATLMALVPRSLLADVPLIVLGIIGFVLLGFSVPDRTRPEPILLAVTCILVGLIFVDDMCGILMVSEPAGFYRALWWMSSGANAINQYCFIFLVARRRMPLFYRVLIGVWVAQNATGLVQLVAPLPMALRLDAMLIVVSPIGLAAGALLGTAPFAAFWRWGGIPSRMRTIAGFCMTWGALMAVFFGTLAVSNAIPKMPVFFSEFLNALFPAQAIVELCIVGAIVALILRDQRQTALERATLAGEMRAARAVQQVIIPEAIPTVPGFAIESVYRSAGEVGGDFFQILRTASGGVLIVIGDVSGKGMPAALTVSLLVGTVRTLAHYTQSPGAILVAMNQRMLGRQQGGFTTCLVLRADSNGKLTVANAGHISPYRNGAELQLENGLPLGLAENTTYSESTFELVDNERLTLLTDGIVEARAQSGELFGFERARAISTQSADSIAQTAQRFGQEDDITVLALTFAHAEVFQT